MLKNINDMSDIVKAVIYDRGAKELNGEKKYFSLIAMVLATDKPLIHSKAPELIAMGTLNIFDELNILPRYEFPHKMGNISNAIIDVSNMSPDDLDLYEQ